MFGKVLLLTILILAVAFAAVGIKMFFKKDGRFERHCANADNPDVGCVCGGRGGNYCKNKGICQGKQTH